MSASRRDGAQARATRAKIDRLMPYRGVCALCGGGDARHREFDSWRGNHRAGEGIPQIARWYERPEPLVRAVVTLSPQAYGWLLRAKCAANEVSA